MYRHGYNTVVILVNIVHCVWVYLMEYRTDICPLIYRFIATVNNTSKERGEMECILVNKHSSKNRTQKNR